MTESPYEYHNNILGFKLKFLISDADRKAVSSLELIKYRSLVWRLDSESSCEQWLRKASRSNCALVEFSTLPLAWKKIISQHFGEPIKVASQTLFQKHFARNIEAFNFFSAYRYGDNNEKKLPAEVVELYTNNASVIDTLLKVRVEQKKLIKAHGNVKVDIWESLSNQVNAFRDVEHDLPSRPGALRNKVTKYKKESYQAIISGKYGLRNAAKVKLPVQNDLLEELLSKHTNPNNEQVAELYNMVAKRVFGWDPITSETVAKYRKENEVFIHGQKHGHRAFTHAKSMLVKRSRPTAPMLYWTIDGWVAELLYQSVDKGRTVYHKRPTVVFVLDPHSNYPIGYAIGTHETPELIKAAVRNAIRHTKELFGKYYKPYQLQSDNYASKVSAKFYEPACEIYTPARVKNAKAKVIEPWFNYFNKKHFQATFTANWSGFGIASNKDNQPNEEYLYATRKDFPTFEGVVEQLKYAIESERKSKLSEYMQAWYQASDEYKIEMSESNFFRYLGETTGYTNRLQPMGLTPTIGKNLYYFDSFNIAFRKYSNVDWLMYYDPEDLSRVLVTNAESRNGKLVKEIGDIEFILEQKYTQPMALADRKEGDAENLHKVFNYNKQLEAVTIERISSRGKNVEELFLRNPELEVLQKLVLPDSKGQHKQLKQNIHIKSVEQIDDNDDFEILDDPRNYY